MSDREVQAKLEELRRIHEWLENNAEPICAMCPCPYHEAAERLEADPA